MTLEEKVNNSVGGKLADNLWKKTNRLVHDQSAAYDSVMESVWFPVNTAVCESTQRSVRLKLRRYRFTKKTV
jgi:hypothetical protein